MQKNINGVFHALLTPRFNTNTQPIDKMLLLPWPPSILSPNNRSHWTKKAKAKALLREACFNLAKNAPVVKVPEGNIHLSLVFSPPSRRKYDLDNALASMKSALDGVADAWGVNDTRFRPITVDMGHPIKGGSVLLRII